MFAGGLSFCTDNTSCIGHRAKASPADETCHPLLLADVSRTDLNMFGGSPCFPPLSFQAISEAGPPKW